MKSLVSVGYVETRPKRMRKSMGDDGIFFSDCWKPELYREEDEKLLGDCKTCWTLSVDGYGKDGGWKKNLPSMQVILLSTCYAYIFDRKLVMHI